MKFTDAASRICGQMYTLTVEDAFFEVVSSAGFAAVAVTPWVARHPLNGGALEDELVCFQLNLYRGETALGVVVPAQEEETTGAWVDPVLEAGYFRLVSVSGRSCVLPVQGTKLFSPVSRAFGAGTPHVFGEESVSLVPALQPADGFAVFLAGAVAAAEVTGDQALVFYDEAGADVGSVLLDGDEWSLGISVAGEVLVPSALGLKCVPVFRIDGASTLQQFQNLAHPAAEAVFSRRLEAGLLELG